MIDLTFCELREKMVFNIVDGKRLGRIIDMAFTLSGHVIGIIVPGERKLLKNINGNDNIFIPWKSIVKIGEDAILVELISDNCNLMIDNDKCDKNC